eukprot:CAMPEP_0203644470 /NCGR_PEP_ID=MMETSP0088-20131115/9897_1 /ASSEMBLY_ACC=CAM_ASM_001087 /TAXON_ID=426623 /ORGANISM="Chaetoceros affinis, Strain CCMP159" /LENGTH=48 /DNA_ID= /DNA_START= /DNA_END= /DNA_ORIENTATION=
MNDVQPGRLWIMGHLFLTVFHSAIIRMIPRQGHFEVKFVGWSYVAQPG